MGNTSAKVKNAWNSRNYDQIPLVLPKGQREELKVHAKKKDGGSVNAFIKRAIAETLARDNAQE